MDTDEEVDDDEEKQETSEEEEEEEEEKEKQETSDEEEEKQETSDEEEVSEGASKRSAASEDEQQKSISLASCSREETHGTKRKHNLSNAQYTLSWVPTALADINSISAHMLRHNGFSAHPSPKTCLPDLERICDAATDLVNNTNAAISFAKAQQNLLDKKDLEGKILALQQELAQSKEQSQAEHQKQDQQAKAELLKQSNLFLKEKESLTRSHKLEREALTDRYTWEQRDLRRQLEEEKDKSICCVCHDKPRDTVILPCLHFQYCFSCLLRHREANSNTCPTCRGPIQGLNMSSYLATQ